MLYFSELRGKKVVTEDQIEIGRLDDLIFFASETPVVTKFLVIDKLKNKLVIPITYLKKINDVILTEKAFTTVNLEENELYLLRNLLDKQIIDLVGNKIVRVNDIVLQQDALHDHLKLYVMGVDIGALGILRWLKLVNLLQRFMNVFQLKFTSHFLSWADIQPLELAHGQVKLKKEEKKLEKLRPEDLADYLEKTNVTNTRKILRILDEKFATRVISDLNINFQNHLFKQFKPEEAAKLLINIDPDEAVDVLLTLSSKRKQQIIDLLPDKKKKEFNYLINLSTTPIGNLLTTEFLTVYPNNTVREVVNKIKNETADFFFITPIFVTNEDKQLIGVFNLHELLLHDLDTSVYKFMTQNVIVIHLSTPSTVALNKMIKYKFAALPVTDNNKKILGLVSITDVMKSVQKNH